MTPVASGGATAQAPAQVSGVQRTASGFAPIVIEGTYTSHLERTYKIEIHVCTDGFFATTRYRWSDTGGTTWNAQNLTPSVAATALNFGLTVRWISTSDVPPFVLNDAWTFAATLKYGVQQVIDGNRDSEWRSGSAPASSNVGIQIDFGAAVAPTVVAILDHNAPASATLKVGAQANATFPPTSFVQTLTWQTGRVAAVISPITFRYWSIWTTVGGTALTYLRFSEIYLGGSTTLGKLFRAGGRQGKRRIDAIGPEAILSHGAGPLSLSQHFWEVTLPRVKQGSGQDITLLQGLWDYTNDVTSRVQRPFFFIPNDANTSDFGLYQWVNDFQWENLFVDDYDVPIQLAEVVRTAA